MKSEASYNKHVVFSTLKHGDFWQKLPYYPRCFSRNYGTRNVPLLTVHPGPYVSTTGSHHYSLHLCISTRMYFSYFSGLGGKTFMRQKVAEANPAVPPPQVNSSPDAATVESGVPRNLSNASSTGLSSGKSRHGIRICLSV